VASANQRWGSTKGISCPNSDPTRYHVASVSKPFTALAILQLQDRGRLQISDPISRYVPTFPHGDRITLDHLLTHKSGIPDINDQDDYDTFALGPHTLEQLVAKFAGLPLAFQPGADQRYSNSDYILLALVVERVSGGSYEEYLRRHVFDPAGMQSSGDDGDATRVIPALASGYRPAGVAGYEKAQALDWSNKKGSGSLYSTAEDLLRFDRALRSDTLLKSETRRKYFVDGPGNWYGWYWMRRSGHRLMAAKGHGPGFTAELDRYPDDDVTVVLLCNSYGTASQGPIAEGLAAIVFGQQPPAVPPIHPLAAAEAILASTAGEYQFGPDYFTPNARITLTAMPGYLLLREGDYHTSLVPVSPTELLERTYFGQVVLAKDAEGRVTGFTVRYGDDAYTARRLATQ
jgi:CubicO group peptidase (beta-lactamase class C family)